MDLTKALTQVVPLLSKYSWYIDDKSTFPLHKPQSDSYKSTEP